MRVEPTDESFRDAIAFAESEKPDAFVAVGGGSVIDTAKAAMVYARYPATFSDYFAPPIGAGVAVPGPVLPHIACPTTSGTGSECTSVSVIRINQLDTKFVIGSPHLLPVEAALENPE